MNITATLGTRGQVLQVHAGSAKAAVGTGAPPGLPAWVPPHPRGLAVSQQSCAATPSGLPQRPSSPASPSHGLPPLQMR